MEDKIDEIEEDLSNIVDVEEVKYLEGRHENDHNSDFYENDEICTVTATSERSIVYIVCKKSTDKEKMVDLLSKRIQESHENIEEIHRKAREQ